MTNPLEQEQRMEQGQKVLAEVLGLHLCPVSPSTTSSPLAGPRRAAMRLFAILTGEIGHGKIKVIEYLEKD
jgi:hypothetical protein